MKNKLIFFLSSLFLVLFTGITWGHFGMLIPSDDMVSASDSKSIILKLMFAHPFEGDSMNLIKPNKFGVMIRGKKIDLLSSIKEKKVAGHTVWEINYKLNKPGDYIFYMEPKPYWEPAEDKYIIHYTKVIVNGFGMEEGWDEPVGLKAEIIPLTRPYGLWVGNVFQGVVKVDGNPVPFAEVEVEYYNEDNSVTAPGDPMITQVIKADKNGVFTYGIPKAGWWGFAALTDSDEKLSHNGKEKKIELGAVIWVKAYKMK